MASMNEKAFIDKFDSLLSPDEPLERSLGRVSYHPSTNLLAIVADLGDIVLCKGENSSQTPSGLWLKPKTLITVDNDSATCVYVLPVASRRSSIIGANWCSVVIGTKSGSLLFYSEEGIALLRQQVFTQSVDAVSISVSATLLGYFYASSGSVVNMIPYGELVAELESRLNALMVSQDGRVPSSAPLNWKSLRLQQVKNTQHIAITHHGAEECHFDQLERCTIEHYGSRGEVSNAANVFVSSVGSDPFYNLTVSREATQANLVSDIAVAVASKFGKIFSDNVPFWGSKSAAESKEEQQPKMSSLGVFSQHGLFDRDRLGTRLCVSPSKRFVAFTDGLARVTLVDAVSGVPLYLMKGYRRAQLGWITSSSLDGSGRQVELLVVHSPKSMQIELWNARKASRVTAFAAPEDQGILLYDSGNISASATDYNHPSIDRQTFFLASSGRLYDIVIPFSEALEFEDLNEMQGHLDDLAEVKKILEEYAPGNNLDRFEKLLKRFKRVSLVQQILKMVCDCPAVDETLVELGLRTLTGKTLRGARKAIARLEGNLSKIERLMEVFRHIEQNRGALNGEGLRNLVKTPDSEGFKMFDKIFDSGSKDESYGLVELRLCDFLSSFSVLADSTDTKIAIEPGDEAEDFVGRLVLTMAEDKGFFRLIREQEVCLWSVTNCVLQNLFSRSTVSGEKVPHNFTALSHILDEVQACTDNLEPFLTEVFEKISATENIPAAMLASIMMQTLLGPQKSSPLEDIEESLECKIFQGLFKQLRSILPLAALLRCHVQDECLQTNEYAKTFSISLKSLSKSDGFISDIVSQWICEQRLGHEHLRKALGRPSDVACFEGTLEEPAISLDVAMQLLCDIRVMFPVSLQPETLMANCCWSYLCLWDQNFYEPQLLLWAMGFLRAIKAYKLKEGLCYMIWKSHLQIRVISMARIMEQSGALSDSHLERHVQVGRCALTEFFNFCSTILDIMIESMLPSDEVELLCPLLKEEALTVGFADGEPSLISRALSLPRALRDTVHLHYSLVTILAYCVQFNLEETQPLSLFDSAAQSALSEDLCEVYQRYNQSAATGALSTHRTTFLRRAAEACVQRLPEVHVPGELLECQACMARLVDLAHAWDVDTDVVNKEYVLQLYSSGHDHLAQEVISQITDRKAMAEALIVMIGLRVRALLGQIDQDTCQKLSVASTRVNRWLGDLPGTVLRCTNKSVDSVLTMVQNVLLLVPESSPEEQLLNDVVLLLTNLDNVQAIEEDDLQ